MSDLPAHTLALVHVDHEEVLEQAHRAGAVVLGRANMDELAMGASTRTSAFGKTHNPPRRTPQRRWQQRRVGGRGGRARVDALGRHRHRRLDPGAGLAARDRRHGRDAGGGPDARGLRVGVLEELRGSRNQSGVLTRLDVVVEAVRRWSRSRPLRPDRAGGRRGRAPLRGGLKLLRELLGPLEVAQAARQLPRSQVTAALEGCDLLLSPTMPTTAPMLESHLSPEELADPLAAPYTFRTVVANLVGLPAISLPSGRSGDDGMPVGTMLMGPPRTDHVLLRAAAALESAGVDAA